ncbi:aldo/keto reductase [Parvularcula oceani]|uniref:aldo/keto reductase n=1 Tax=Parvularcula oceani TaxID=1247963 RepID=UPI0004E0C1A5|nr:aldo/keto reductase [Parvularcula oceani]
MTSRRTFLGGAAVTAAATLLNGPAAARTQRSPATLPRNEGQNGRFVPGGRFGMGGTQAGSVHFRTPAEQAAEALQASWDEGVRYFDTSPWYGLGLSERRFGTFFDDKPRDGYILSTKVGRVLIPDSSVAGTEVSIWAQVPPFRHEYDYSADGIRRSIEQSLQRLGLAQLDVVFIHDLSPDNADLGEDWTEHFDVARRGAMPELTRMREEGIIKAWGMGVNTPEPILRALEVSDPDIMLVATQYSLALHEPALNGVMPAIAESGATAVIGAPLNDGFLAGRNRFNYGPIPPDMRAKRSRLDAIAQAHDTDLRTAALQFAAAHPAVSSIIPGARSASQAHQNAQSMRKRIDPALWEEFRAEGLIAQDAPVPS